MNIQEVAEGKARLVGLNFVEPEKNKAYRPNAHLLYFVMHYNGSII